MNKPVIFLAFANDREQYLHNLHIEQRGIREALKSAREAGLCEVVERNNTTIRDLFDVFQEYQDRVAVFHYGGHADDYLLLLESETGERAIANSGGLISFLAQQKALQLVFINGCSSKQQALDLSAAGVPAVVGTAQPIDDAVATDLAARFYKGLATGATIDRAWAAAVDQMKTQKGEATFRALSWKGKSETHVNFFPWEIYYRQGAEIVKDWNLPEAVENPLFGLPEIPKTYDLPETPFLFLKRYERQHAEIFFGRSYYIRDLYNRVSDPNSPPVILLYGQSGVGKSSLFDAGLNPRLEKNYKVIYIRRFQEKGLAGTLAYALEQALATLSEPLHDFPAAPEKPAAESPKSQATLSHLEAAAENASDDLKQEIAALILRLQSGQQLAVSDLQPATSNQQRTTSTPQQTTDNELLAKWQKSETQTGKPLIIILDQVEELYTRRNEKFPDELADFLVALRSIFGSPARRPSGKLILGYRKEYHPEIEDGFKTFLLPRATVFLESLRRKDILEVFRGVSQTSALKQFYNLSVEDELPVIIADDLLEDKESPVAPVLQILLTKMWNAAKQENPPAPRFTIKHYQQLKKDGIAMGEFFAQQMEQLRTWQPEVVDSGLALDVLQFHVTALGTAGSRSLEELRQTYLHRQDIIDALVAKCKEFYLLTEAHNAQHTSLTHDTLAPVVAKEYNTSDRFGQRAARILHSKTADFRQNRNKVWLDEADLAIVEQGNEGMCKLDDDEEELLVKSREKRRQGQRLRRRLWTGGIIMLLAIVASAIFAFIQMQEAEVNLLQAKENEKEAKRQKAIADSLRLITEIVSNTYKKFTMVKDTSSTEPEVFLSQLRQIMPAASDAKLRDFSEAFNKNLRVLSEINTPKRLAAFLAQIAHESSELKFIIENPNYSARSLMAVWPRLFPDLQKAQQYERNPEKIANYIYANRMGNGGEASGDGWKYRGRGLIQILGRDNYKKFGEILGYDLVANPDQAGTMEVATAVACLFWNKNGLNQLADAEMFQTITKRITGGLIGFEDRLKYYKKALEVLKAK